MLTLSQSVNFFYYICKMIVIYKYNSDKNTETYFETISKEEFKKEFLKSPTKTKDGKLVFEYKGHKVTVEDDNIISKNMDFLHTGECF